MKKRFIMTLIFLILKLCGVIPDVSWLWIFLCMFVDRILNILEASANNKEKEL